MSTQINQYHCFGHLLPYEEAKEAIINHFNSEDMYEKLMDDFHDSAFDNKIKEIDGISIIQDGMDGKYIFFGKIYSKSSDHCYIETFEVEKPKKYLKLLLKFKLKEYFGDKFNELKPNTMLLTHYR